jgi:hypothetical protein
MTVEGWSARGAGALLVAIAAVLVAAMTAGRVGIGAGVEYFRDDFPKFADNLDRAGVALYLIAILGVISIVAAGLLFAALQAHSPALAVVGACLLLASGILWLVETAVGRALYDLASEWRATIGQPYDAIWTAARGFALIYEILVFITIFLMLNSLLAFGVLCLRCAVLPRWLGGLATVAGMAPFIALAFAGVLGESAFYVFMAGGALGLSWFVIAGIWLLARGSARTAPLEQVAPPVS